MNILDKIKNKKFRTNTQKEITVMQELHDLKMFLHSKGYDCLDLNLEDTEKIRDAVEMVEDFQKKL